MVHATADGSAGQRLRVGMVGGGRGAFIGAVHRAPADFPSGRAGDVLTVEFTVCGVPCVGLNGGPAFPQTAAFSFQIATEDQALGQELQGTVLEVEDTEVAYIATSTDELRSALLRLDADVAIVDELLGPEPVLSVVRDLSVRRPATAMLLASKAADAERFAREHPLRQEVRIVAGATRAGATYCALRLRAHDDDQSVVDGTELVPGLLDLLRSTLEGETQ